MSAWQQLGEVLAQAGSSPEQLDAQRAFLDRLLTTFPTSVSLAAVLPWACARQRRQWQQQRGCTQAALKQLHALSCPLSCLL